MTIEPVRLAQLVLFATMLATGQLLFKQVALSNAVIRDLPSAMRLFTHPYFWVALVLYGLASLLWIYLLQRMALSIAYSFAAIVFALVPLGAWFFFGEPLKWSYGLGAGLIMAGVITIGATSA